jgi:hypothetical protein
MISSPHHTRALALLFTAGLFAGCETPSSPSPAPSASSAAPQPSSVASTVPPTADSAAAHPSPKEADTAIVIGEKQVFHSTILGEDRTLLVHTPASYKQGKESYPVLYLLDAGDNFHHTTGITAFLSEVGRAPEIMVVGVANTGDSRDRDLTPTAVKDSPGSGGAAKFLSFLKDEVRPRIEGGYRTAPYRILVGHSFGALFALHVLTTAPGAFDAYVAMSPSLWWDDKVVLHGAEKSFASHPDLQSFVYMTMGNENGPMLPDVTAFATLLKAKGPKGVRSEFNHLEHENHGSSRHRATYAALETLFSGWEAPPDVVTLAGLKTHYEALSKKLHFEVKLSEQLLISFVYRIAEKHEDEATAAMLLSVQLHPDSPGAYDLLGTLYEHQKKLDLARTNFETAVRKATAISDPGLDGMKANLARLNKPPSK